MMPKKAADTNYKQTKRKAIVSVNNVSLSFGKKQVLKNVSIDLFPEEILSIIGANGAGKTSLLKIIAGIYKPTSGAVSHSTKLCSYVPQKLEFDRTVPITVSDFLTLYNPAISAKKISKTLKELSIDTLAQEFMGTLSGGELQKVLIVQALLNDPKVILLDEPTASIDTMGEDKFFGLLEKLHKERKLSIILVSHDIHTVFSRSTRVVCLNQHVCCQGKPTEVTKTKGFKEVYGDYLAPYHHDHDHCAHHAH